MQTIVVASQKGGSGKTTLTAHLAVAAGRSGSVVVIDTDPQQTLSTWWENREAETPALAPVSLRELPGKLEALAEGFDYCLIDTPPALSAQNRQILQLADLVLVPTRPSPNDIWSLPATLDLIGEARAPFVFVMSQAKPNTQITVQSIAALSERGRVLPSIVHDRVPYAAAMTDGRTALEVAPSSSAAIEIEALWVQVAKRLRELAKGRSKEPTEIDRRVKIHA